MKKIVFLLFFCLPIKSSTVQNDTYVPIPEKNLFQKIDELNYRLDSIDNKIKVINELTVEIDALKSKFKRIRKLQKIDSILTENDETKR